MGRREMARWRLCVASAGLLPWNDRRERHSQHHHHDSARPSDARAYGSAAPQQKRKIQALPSLWLRELTASEPPSLQQVLDDAGRKAQERGLTPEMLDPLLKGA
jgi:hypothetical protein